MVRLLLAEKGTLYSKFSQTLASLHTTPLDAAAPTQATIIQQAQYILEGERAAIEAPGKWRNRRGAFGWPPWSRLRTWACGRPHFPT